MTDEKSKYQISVGQYGSIDVSAPTKEECLEMFREVTSVKKKDHLDEAIR